MSVSPLVVSLEGLPIEITVPSGVTLPTLTPGVLWMNQAFQPNARLLDLAPTILDALGVSPSPEMEGVSL